MSSLLFKLLLFLLFATAPAPALLLSVFTPELFMKFVLLGPASARAPLVAPLRYPPPAPPSVKKIKTVSHQKHNLRMILKEMTSVSRARKLCILLISSSSHLLVLHNWKNSCEFKIPVFVRRNADLFKRQEQMWPPFLLLERKEECCKTYFND